MQILKCKNCNQIPIFSQFSSYVEEGGYVYLGCDERGNDVSVFVSIYDDKSESEIMEELVIKCNAKNE